MKISIKLRTKMDNLDVIEVLNKNQRLRDKIFSRGFIFTTGNINDQEYPFYGEWNNHYIKGAHLLTHPKTPVSIYDGTKTTWILIGHAYNPISELSDEKNILNELDNADDNVFEVINQLTGIFTIIWINGMKICFAGDATCMQSTFYTVHNKETYISSHTNLIGDLLSLKWDEYVKRLVQYRLFGLFGNSLPGDLTQFSNVKRAVPNFYYEIDNALIKEKRFFTPQKLSLSNQEIVEMVSHLLSKNMELIAKKWNKPAISLTGGCDSKTTLSCTKNLYDKFSYFSYISSDEEELDAKGAQIICDKIGLEHKTFVISQNDENFPDIEDIRTILLWNNGGIRKNNRNDVRKRAFFANSFEFDIEVKSWASEIGRAYYSKRFNGRKNFGKEPTPKKCTTMYKIFLHNRKLVKSTEKVFEEYLNKYFQQHEEAPIEWQEQFFWEFRVPSWNGLVITAEHRYSFDITIPYNNRYILQYLLSASIDDRINDAIYNQIRAYMNPEIDNTGVSVTNTKHTKNRAKIENLYYSIHTKIPF